MGSIEMQRANKTWVGGGGDGEEDSQTEVIYISSDPEDEAQLDEMEGDIKTEES